MTDSGDSGNPGMKVAPSSPAMKAGAGRERPPPMQAEATPGTGHERVEVEVDQLDRLLKHAAEASICRARMLQQNKTTVHELENLDRTLAGMRKRLAELELWAEARELYAALQQDASNLSDSGEALGDLSREMKTLLRQQATVTSDLQDGLLKARGLSSSPVIADVLLVWVADKLLAIPHAHGFEIIRLTPQELASCYQGKTAGITYAGAEYRVRYLGAMLGLEQPALSSTGKWYPVLLAGPAERREAVQLDQLLGSMQVMVQPLGAQLDSLRWFTGGTILADGRIALLLDLNILLDSFNRQEHTRDHAHD